MMEALGTAGHVLVIGDGMSLAHVARAMVFARRLVREGKRVTFATSPHYRKLARQEGFEPEAVHCVPPEYALSKIRSGSHIFDMKTLSDYVASDHELFNRVKPDCIVADTRLSLNISAQQARIPYYNIVNAYLTRYYAGPERAPRTLPLTRLLGERLADAMFPLIKRRMVRFYAAAFRKLRRRQGLAPIEDIYDVIASPHGNFIADLPELFPCRDLPAHFRYIGPLIWEPDLPPPPWLDDLDPQRPTVYVTMGSTGDPRVTQRVLAILSNVGYQTLATIGEGDDLVLPNDVYWSRYAPGGILARRADVVVCHGGSLTVYQALANNAFVIGMPTFHDQEYNLRALTARGLGVALHPREPVDRQLERAIQTLPRLDSARFFAIRTSIEAHVEGPLVTTPPAR